MPRQKRASKKLKSVKVSVNAKKIWEHILSEVEKEEVPLRVLESIKVLLVDGTTVTINIRELLSSGADPDVLEESLNKKFDSLDEVITNIDFYVDVQKVAETVQDRTNQILKNL